VPLLFEPGDGWCYGCGVEWAGRMVERVTGSNRLGEYMKEHIFGSLGMKSTGFRVLENQTIKENLVGMSIRTAAGEIMPGKHPLPEDPATDSGAGGLYSSPNDYIKVLSALLKKDGTLLKKELVELMFTPQLSDNKALLKAFASPGIGAMFRSGVEGQAWNYGLGGAVNTESVAGFCNDGTFSWNGVPNIFWVSIILEMAPLY
jgi:CubicO group peptidase (beta-lactamase class C family)